MKRLICCFLTVLMLLSLAMPAYAAELSSDIEGGSASNGNLQFVQCSVSNADVSISELQNLIKARYGGGIQITACID